MITAVVVTHAAPPATLAACIGSIRRAGGVDHIVVVDNGGHASVSGDDVAMIVTPNRGYGAAANEGLRRALELGASAIAVLLNDDVTVRDGWVEPLASALEQRGVGAAQPKLLIAGSSPPRVNSLGVAIGRDGAGTDIGDGSLDVVVGSSSVIDRFTGGAVMFAPDFLRETGGFDERFFLYYEDADLGARGHQLGWSYRLVPASVVDHERGSTTAGNADRTWYLQERNRLWHAFRHCDGATQMRALWLSVRRLRHQPRGVHVRALLAGLAGAPVAWFRRARRANSAGALR